MSLPFLTSTLPGIEADFRAAVEDFQVDEVPAYAPSGAGDHVFALIEKRDLTTPEAVRAICEHVGADPQGAGWAGLKDRRSIARQWISVSGASVEAVRGTEAEGVRVLEAVAHPHKIRTGHLRANRFRIRLRNVDPARMNELRAVLSLIEVNGLPNYYGEQRFGRDRDNAEKALRWVRGDDRAPRSRFRRKLEISALQAMLFNRSVSERVRTSTLGKVFAGDLMKKHESGGLFVAEDLEADQPRADSWEISPTGPIFGAKMRWPAGESHARETRWLEEAGLTPDILSKWKRIAPGTRRFVRVPVGEIGLSVSGPTVELDFTLPAGSYATILVREIRKRDASDPKSS